MSARAIILFHITALLPAASFWAYDYFDDYGIRFLVMGASASIQLTCAGLLYKIGNQDRAVRNNYQGPKQK